LSTVVAGFASLAEFEVYGGSMRSTNLGLRRAAALAMAVALVAVLASASAAFCPRVKYIEPGDKRASVAWTPGIDERDIPDFGGYRVWIRDAWRVDELELIREYRWGVTDTAASNYWDFVPFYEDSVRVFETTALQNAFPYEFSVTAFRASHPEPDSLELACREANTSNLVYPREGVTTDLDKIQAIPNPYRSSADWEYGGQRRIAFVGLSSQATVRIYTTAGTLVRTLRHDDPDSDLESWDLRNDDGEEVAPGLYIWDVDAGELGSISGKVMIMK